MHYGKTTASVNLRKEPSTKAPILDALEPNYPLRVLNYGPSAKWYRVVVPPRGKRDEAQDGWIDARYVRVEDEPEPWRRVKWAGALIALAAIAAAFAAWMIRG